MKVILNVPDEGYSRSASSALNLIYTFLLLLMSRILIFHVLIINFTGLPITCSPDVFRQYKDILLEIGKQGPVLFHCAIGKRAGENNKKIIKLKLKSLHTIFIMLLSLEEREIGVNSQHDPHTHQT